MRGVARILLALFCVLCGAPLLAAGAEDKSYLESLLEERLSGPGYHVTIEGFEGALSSQARVARIAIADGEGTWLEIRDATLDWQRAALLRGRLEVEKLSAARITLSRRPKAAKRRFTPEARAFTLPELPVSVRIGRIEAREITLGASVLGAPVRGTLAGSARLDASGGEVLLSARRTDGRRGRLELSARLAREEGRLTLRLVVDEGPRGVVANLLKIPNRPALLLEMLGNGTAADFAGRFRLASDGAPRLSGTVRLAGTETTGETRAEIAASGDIRPLLAERHRPFFESGVRLQVDALRAPDRSVQVSAFRLATGALEISGTAELSADLVPQAVDIRGTIDPGEAPWLIPIPGQEARLGAASFRFSLFPREHRNLRFQLMADQVSLPTITIDRIAAMTQGHMAKDGDAIALDFTASGEGFAAADPALADLLGAGPHASGHLEWARGGPLRVSALRVDAARGRAMAEGEIEAVAAELRLSGRIASEIDDLAPVGTAMGRSMGGRAEATAAGALSLPSGAFDVELLATARDLRTGTAALDALLGAEARLEASLRRDAEGMAIDRFQVAAADLDLDGRGHLTSAGGAFSATAHIADLGRVAPGVAGKATATLRGKGTPEGWDIEASAAGPGGATATAAGRAFLPGGRHDLEVDARFPLALVGRLVAPRRLGGEVSATLRLRGPAMLSAVSGRAALRDGSLSAPALRLSLEAIEGTASLSEGTARIAVRGRGREGGQLSLGGDLNIATPGLPASLQLELDRLVVRDRLLFDTEATGRLSATGNLLQHIDITGRIELGKTEVRIAPVGGGAAPLPPLRHVGAPPEVRRTLRYAGVDERTTESAPLPVGLDIVVAAPRLFLRGYGVDAEFGGRVRLGGTLGDVVPAGGFDLVRGRLSILGRRFDLLEGTLRSRGSFTPDIHLVAEAESADGIVARIQLSGPADAPELTVTSDPPLPEEEALAHLFFARGSANLSPLQAFRLAGALASLSGHESAAERLRLGFGLDNLDIRQDTDTTTFALGKYVTDNAYTEITVDTEGRSTISLNVDVGRNLTAKARLSDDRETGFGIFWQRDY